MSKVVVDARGEQCPMPVVKTTKALQEMQEGMLEVHVDNEIAVQNVLRMVTGKGLEAKSEQQGEKHFVITAAVNGALAAEAVPSCCAPMGGDTVVAIGSAAMGVGDDALGRTLMKGFIYALSQQEVLPAAVLFYNGGASIPTEGSVSLEDLKAMEAQGVEILTCGTCLDFYGLKDKLAVGGVTNMYSIVEKLSKAGKVIKP